MKLLLIGSLLVSGGGVVAMQNEEVNETVTKNYEKVREYVQNRFGTNLVEEAKEAGFPYPSEEYLASLTEEQALAVVTEIDLINATYDWPNMTNEEIKDALSVVKEQLSSLYEELGIEGPGLKGFRDGFKEMRMAERIAELRESGLSYPSEERLADLSDEQVTAITTKIDELNAANDWASMTDEEIAEAAKTAREEMKLLCEELGIELPQRDNARAYNKGYHKGFRDGFRHGRNQEGVTQDDSEPSTDGEDLV